MLDEQKRLRQPVSRCWAPGTTHEFASKAEPTSLTRVDVLRAALRPGCIVAPGLLGLALSWKSIEQGGPPLDHTWEPPVRNTKSESRRRSGD